MSHRRVSLRELQAVLQLTGLRPANHDQRQAEGRRISNSHLDLRIPAETFDRRHSIYG